jgi:hypothetical protein
MGEAGELVAELEDVAGRVGFHEEALEGAGVSRARGGDGSTRTRAQEAIRGGATREKSGEGQEGVSTWSVQVQDGIEV